MIGRVAVLTAALVATLVAFPAAQPGAPSEYQLKAAYLVNFARFADWPPASRGEDGFNVCVLGEDPFGPVLESTFAGLTVAGQRVVGLRLADLERVQECRVLYIAASEAPRLEAILKPLTGVPVLTVSDIAQFGRRGGMIEFVMSGDRVRFEVDLRPVQEAGLMLSSSLLRVATVVRPGVRR